MNEILSGINCPDDLKKQYIKESASMLELASEMRTKLIDTVSQNGGHLASNLGVVELTIALHLAFEMPRDSFVFDVGHQSYVHKMLTGRYGDISTLRKYNGISGFPKRSESEYDCFNSGHASNSISAALGIACAKKLNNDDSYTVAIIGDASLSGGEAMEGINNAGQTELPLIIVLNDNKMAISDTVGAMGKHLAKLRMSKRYISFKKKTKHALQKTKVGHSVFRWIERQRNRLKYLMLRNVVFESMGYKYIGPVDGHDIDGLYETFESAKRLKMPVIVHVVTQKGRGYAPAEQNPEKFHGIGSFNVETAQLVKKSAASNSSVFGNTLLELARNDERIIAITAAMPTGTGLVPFSKELPDRFFDVGIAEQHAVTFAAGAATRGMRPVVAVYSTFLQRAYDQIIEDVCLQKLPVVFGIDRAGLVGEDGETHQGVYDIAYLLTVPGIDIYSPSTVAELAEMLKLALSKNKPAAIRYNRGLLPDKPIVQPVEYGKWEIVRPLRRVNIITTGRMVDICEKAAGELNVGIVNARFLNMIDSDVITMLREKSYSVLTVEDGIVCSGFGVKLNSLLAKRNVIVQNIGVPQIPIPHATTSIQDKLCGMSEADIRAKLVRMLVDSVDMRR